jgi:hypothetical protein
MDEAVERFRRQARRELGDRQGAERRYSADLRAQAIAYWRTRASAGDGLLPVATALGIAPWTLHRWARTGTALQRVAVIADVTPAPPARLTVIVTADTLRVEGLDLDTAAQLIARLR